MTANYPTNICDVSRDVVKKKIIWEKQTELEYLELLRCVRNDFLVILRGYSGLRVLHKLLEYGVKLFILGGETSASCYVKNMNFDKYSFIFIVSLIIIQQNK